MINKTISRVNEFNESKYIERKQENIIIIRNIAPELTKPLLWELLIQAGPLAYINLTENIKNKTVAICQFIHEVSAEYAYRLFNGILLFDTPLQIELGIPKKGETGASVYIRNMPATFNENSVFELFFPYGYIISVTIPETNSNSKYGFVNFLRREDADRAIKEFSKLNTSLEVQLTDRAKKERESII